MNDDREWRAQGPSGRIGEPSERERQRAAERERRANERAAMAQERSDRRAAEREQASREREARREARQAEEAERMKVLRPEPAGEAEPKRRASGALRRTGEIRVERDTRHYRTVVDVQRMRQLAARGASISSMAAVFKISAEEVEAALAEPAGAE